jgi:hypothetical protein
MDRLARKSLREPANRNVRASRFTRNIFFAVNLRAGIPVPLQVSAARRSSEKFGGAS